MDEIETDDELADESDTGTEDEDAEEESAVNA